MNIFTTENRDDMLRLIFSILMVFSFLGVYAQEDGITIDEDTTIDTCDEVIYGPGGPDGTNGNNDTFTVVICPDEDDQLATISFTEFDYLNSFNNFQITVYDGDEVDGSDVLVQEGGLLNDELEFITASDENESGCLTLVIETGFVPPNFDTNAYFTAELGCRPPCQEITAELLSIEADNVCSEPDAAEEVFPINEEITFTADAVTSNNSNFEDLTFEWLIDGDEYEGDEVTASFGDSGVVTGQLIVYDEYQCDSDPISFSFTIGDEMINITERGDEYSLEELISEVLISGSCADVDNITSPSNSADAGGSFESIGYFNRGCSDFMFEDGIIIGSGSVKGVDGDGGISSSTAGWDGDTMLGEVGGDPNNTNNATIIQFEFSSFEDQISFNYIYASQEYTSTYPCTYADPFAFVVSGPGIDDVNLYDHDANPDTPLQNQDLGGINIATVSPDGSTDLVPTTATNIHPGPPSFNCGDTSLGGSYLPQFFDELDPSQIALNGVTRPLTATIDVIPCETYTLTIGIADWNDTILDSYVFLEGGSFDLGIDLGDDITLEDDEALCDGEEIELCAFDGEIPCNVEVIWTRDGEIIEGEDGECLTVTQAGLYEVIIDGDDAGSGCSSGDEILIEYYPRPEIDEDALEDLTECDPFDGDPVYDLTVNDPRQIDGFITIGDSYPLDDPDTNLDELIEVAYFESLEDAENFENPIEDPENYTPPAGADFPFTIYVRANENVSGEQQCENIESFDLEIGTAPINELDDLYACADEDNPNGGFGIFDLTENDSEALSGQDPDQFEVEYFESFEDAENGDNPIEDLTEYNASSNPQSIYARLARTDVEGCFDLTTFDLITHPQPEMTTLADLEQCGDFTYTQEFDLTENNVNTVGTPEPDNIASVDYYLTETDADNDENAITNPDAYVMPDGIDEQTI
ncbi:MAG: choice-of-anchor L domain-containing protein, partial [Bacteroidota bacterium]